LSSSEASGAERRKTLDRAQVLRGGVDVADAHGLESLSMRKLANALGVEAMSLYNHVANKDDLLDGMVDVVVSEFESPTGSGAWRPIIRRCAIAAHGALLRHPWVAALSESRMQSGPARLGYYESIFSVFRRDGFSVRGAYQANLTLDSYLYGFTLQEVNWPRPSPEVPDLVEQFMATIPADTYPRLVEMATLAAQGLDLADDFEVGLDLVLDGLERLRDGAMKHRRRPG
jgi:AcrR family transcriptional regulator